MWYIQRYVTDRRDHPSAEKELKSSCWLAFQFNPRLMNGRKFALCIQNRPNNESLKAQRNGQMPAKRRIGERRLIDCLTHFRCSTGLFFPYFAVLYDCYDIVPLRQSSAYDSDTFSAKFVFQPKFRDFQFCANDKRPLNPCEVPVYLFCIVFILVQLRAFLTSCAYIWRVLYKYLRHTCVSSL